MIVVKPAAPPPAPAATYRLPRAKQRLATVQGAYFLATGVWPLLHSRSFLAVTGPKTDVWLMKTVGVLVAIIGGALLLAGARGRVHPEIEVLAAGSATALAGIDVRYALRGRISKVYLLDALAELALVGAWAAGWRGRRARPV